MKIMIAIYGVILFSIVGCQSKEDIIDYRLKKSRKVDCIGGYKFVLAYEAMSQILDDQGRGIKCE